MRKKSLFLRYLTVLFLAAAILIPPFFQKAEASSFRSGDQITVNERVNDDLYVTGGNVTLNGTINGDLFVMGGSVTINGAVTEDIFVMGGDVTIEGNVVDDIRIMGGNVKIRGNVGEDLLVMAGNVEITREGRVNRDVNALAGQLTVAGTTKTIKGSIGKLTLTNTAVVDGDIDYISPNDPQRDSRAEVTGNINRRSDDKTAGAGIAFGILFWLMTLLSAIIIALIYVYLLPFKTFAIVRDWRENLLLSLFTGFSFLIFTPMVIALVSFTVIGIPISVILSFLYPLILFMGYIMGIIATGFWIENRFLKESMEHGPTWFSVITGAIAYNLLLFIPFIGWLIATVISLTGIGSYLRFNWFTYHRLRKEKVL